jgi:Cdc6-like AAA superfamily ATPase
MARTPLEGPELLDRLRLVGEAFRPAAPIDRRELFAGRTRQIAEIFSAVSQPGQHVVVYGERGVGKTSLASVTSEMLQSSNVLTSRATCDTSDDFGSLWRKALDEIVVTRPTRGVGFAAPPGEAVKSAAALIGGGDVAPNAVRKALRSLAGQREVVVFIDEFDRVQDARSRTLLADTIKTLSDQLVRATVVLVGVADDVSDLVREHASVERALVQIHMPRMSRDELEEIVATGVRAARMTVAKAASRRIAAVSQGLPHYTHLLAQLAAQTALDTGRTEIRVADVDHAIQRAISRAQQSISDAYRDAVAGTRSTLYPSVLLACALADGDEYGSFSPADVREPLTALAGREYETRAFAKHLDALADGERGPVLHKRGSTRTARYRFANPLLQPYVVLRGLSEGRVKPAALR